MTRIKTKATRPGVRGIACGLPGEIVAERGANHCEFRADCGSVFTIAAHEFLPDAAAQVVAAIDAQSVVAPTARGRRKFTGATLRRFISRPFGAGKRNRERA